MWKVSQCVIKELGVLRPVNQYGYTRVRVLRAQTKWQQSSLDEVFSFSTTHSWNSDIFLSISFSPCYKFKKKTNEKKTNDQFWPLA